MKHPINALCLMLFFGLLGCTQPGTYPVTGQECAPGDPVQELDAADCAVPGLP